MPALPVASADSPDAFAAALDHRFATPGLLEQALTHRSVLPATGGGRGAKRGPDPGERLEFLGDRVLGLIVAEMLFEAYPAEAEGDLARRHAQLVRRETLAEIARQIGLPAQLRLAATEEAGARDRPNILGDACEAVIAALYLDGGFEAAARFVRRYWTPPMAAAAAPPKDAKTRLQEWSLAHGGTLPAYTLVAASGPDHAREFTIEVAVGEARAAAAGASKRAAETAAAEALYARLTAP